LYRHYDLDPATMMTLKPMSSLTLTLVVLFSFLALSEGKGRRQRRRSPSKSKKNCYQKLGVPTDADERRIKKAFRKLALKYHPDKVEEAEKEESEAKFKALAHCYEILTDEEQRRLYDASGFNEDYAQNGGAGASGFQFTGQGMDFSDLFQSFFGGAGSGGMGGSNGFAFNFGGPSAGGGAPFGFGGEPEMGGAAGTRARHRQSEQNAFGGHHQHRSRQQRQTSKPQKVFVDLEALLDDSLHTVSVTTSRGKGAADTVEVEVPRGCPEGHIVEERGHRFEIHSNPHRDFSRGLLSHKSDLYQNVTITLEQALLGFTLEVLTIDGELIEERMERAPDSLEHRVARKGLPRFDAEATTRGHLFVRFDVLMPTLSAAEKREMEQKREADGAWDYSEARKYRKKMDDRRRRRAQRRNKGRKDEL